MQAWRVRSGRNENGKWPITFQFKQGYADKEIRVPCGQCIGCRLEKSRVWALRCLHESQLHEQCCFLTLTYRDNPGTLVLRDLQNFFKRLRKAIYPIKVRYYACGEYGSNFGRPHYHCLLFGYDFSRDRVLFKRSGTNALYSSRLLDSLWTHGYCLIGDVSFDSCAYVARYCVKKVTGEGKVEHYVDPDTGELRKPEFAVMSRRPGIGLDWFLRYRDEVMAHEGMCYINGVFCKIPRYYEEKDACAGNDGLVKLRQARAAAARRVQDMGEQSPDRLAVREECAEMNLARLKRGYEETASFLQPFE